MQPEPDGDCDHASGLQLALGLIRDKHADAAAERRQVSVLSFGAGTFGRQSSKEEVLKLVHFVRLSCEIMKHWRAADGCLFAPARLQTDAGSSSHAGGCVRCSDLAATRRRRS